ncbi:hypothetical protein OROGR_017396 [Orobanche gracilis]
MLVGSGFCVAIWIAVFMSKSNDIVRKQMTLKGNSGLQVYYTNNRGRNYRRQTMARKREEEGEFRKMMLTWIKEQEKKPAGNKSSVSDSSVISLVCDNFVEFCGGNSNSDNTSAESDLSGKSTATLGLVIVDYAQFSGGVSNLVSSGVGESLPYEQLVSVKQTTNQNVVPPSSSCGDPGTPSSQVDWVGCPPAGDFLVPTSFSGEG